jgi:DNA-binding LytR/AlgR family response regulator
MGRRVGNRCPGSGASGLACRDYVRVHAAGRVRLLRARMSVLEASLDPAAFVRTHRSALVRADLIRELRAESAYSYSAMLVSGARVPVSRESYKALEARLSRG